jgi:nucleoside-diphosphate-sugar epimerase
MKILIVGGTGHIGTYLVPRLVLGGHEVSVVARHPEPRYADARLSWGQVTWIEADRRAEEAAGTWGARMAALDVDVVIDLICFTPEQNRVMVEAFEGRISQFIHCGTIWAYGPTERASYEEHFPRKPITEYGIRKAQIEADLLAAYRMKHFPATIIHPGHICGRKWLPIDPQGTRDGVGVYEKLAQGETVHLPDLGLATLHHVHADDVAQLFELALTHRERALGESFSAVAPYAMSLRGCATFVAALFGQTANLAYVPLEAMREYMGEDAYRTMYDHVRHSPCASIAKGKARLGYAPRYTTEQIYMECVAYLLESGQLAI